MSDRTRRLLVLLATLAGMAVTARLGFWQLDRAAQKLALETSVASQSGQAAVTNATLAVSEAEAQSQWQRPVRLQGVWLSEATVYLDNRQMRGRPGFFVLTPLLLTSGDAVLVQRGWVPRDQLDRTRLPAVLTPTGMVTVAGRVVPWPSQLTELGADVPGPIQQNIDRGQLGERIQMSLRPLSVVELPGVTDGPSSAPGAKAAADGLLRDWPQPASGVHKHYGYAAQWFVFCAMMAALYLWFQILRPWRTHAKQ
ncbi:SURF1 family protein [Ideonella sp.]|uniref:SURF1 family protein n=1 Tax=Ideonella sp. TaxID=1929293 RepID=UPI003BB74D2F